jgi:hypothetical protein
MNKYAAFPLDTVEVKNTEYRAQSSYDGVPRQQIGMTWENVHIPIAEVSEEHAPSIFRV